MADLEFLQKMYDNELIDRLKFIIENVVNENSIMMTYYDQIKKNYYKKIF